MKTGKKKKNKYKNRFRDVTPYDVSRVKLKVLDEDESTDYINANWIRDMNDDPKKIRKKAYISTQGPIIRVNDDYPAENADTCPDFWRMVWENDVEVIVMLTKCSEDAKETEKCTPYWPKKVGEEKNMEALTLLLLRKKEKR